MAMLALSLTAALLLFLACSVAIDRLAARREARLESQRRRLEGYDWGFAERFDCEASAFDEAERRAD